MKKPVSILSLVAALGLFFLPWMELECSGMSMASQTGVQALTGEVVMGSDIENTMNNIGNEFGQAMGAEQMSEKAEPKSDYVDKAIYILIAAVVIVIAIVLCALGQFTIGGIFGAVAGLLLIMQIAAGFPVKKEALESQKNKEGKEMTEQDERMFNAMMEEKIQPAMYLTILCCFVPLGVSFVRGKKQELVVPETPPVS